MSQICEEVASFFEVILMKRNVVFHFHFYNTISGAKRHQRAEHGRAQRDRAEHARREAPSAFS